MISDELVLQTGADLAVADLSTQQGVARVQMEIQAAVLVAMRNQRDEDAARTKLVHSCKRPVFAEQSVYAFQRGGSTVEGPSVQMAREAARLWRNIRYGAQVIRDDEESRLILCFAWDLESNTHITQEVSFKKKIQRKQKGGGTEWVTPDERDLRELTNRQGSIGVRNCILQVVPKDIIDEAMDVAKRTIRDKAAEDPDGQRKKVCDAFMSVGVSPEMLAEYLKHPIAACSPDEIAKLRMLYKSISDGNSTWSEIANNASGGVQAPQRKSEAEAAETPKPAEQPKQEAPQPEPVKQPEAKKEEQKPAPTPEPEILPKEPPAEKFPICGFDEDGLGQCFLLLGHDGPHEVPMPDAEPQYVKVINEMQRRKLFGIIGKARPKVKPSKDWETECRAWIQKEYGFTSTADITEDKFNAIIAHFEAVGAGKEKQ